MTKRVTFLLMTLLLPLVLLASFFFTSRARAGSADVCSTCTYPTIQAAAANGPENVPLLIAAGTFFENVEITRSVIFQGAGSGLTIIDGQMTDTAVLINGAVTVSISDLTIRNGDASLDGGGVLSEGGNVSLTNVIVEDNRAPNGAGITNNGNMVLSNVVVRNNVADEVVANVSVCPEESPCTGGGIFNLGVLTITNGSMIHGNTAQFGGGIENANNSTILADGVQIYNNLAANSPSGEPSAGGGIENLGTMTVTNSTIRNNNAPLGAGIANGGTLTVSDSDVYSNIASTRGGGIHNSFSLTVQTSNIYDNEAGSSGGGGISSESGDVVVKQTAVYNNSAQFGGGILHNVVVGANSFTITNSTLSGNSVNGAGGALRNAGIANTTLNNVTFNNNTAINLFEGQSVSVAGGTVTTKNSIINSTGTDCSGTLSSNGYNLVSDSSCGLAGTADLVNAAPQLGALQDNGGGTLTHALQLGSPAIDSGSGCPAVDQRGVGRPVGAACDRGAYEFATTSELVYLPILIRP